LLDTAVHVATADNMTAMMTTTPTPFEMEDVETNKETKGISCGCDQ